jgi:hypothetical protein
MTEPGGAQRFQSLGPAKRNEYTKAARAMVRLAESYSIPIIFAPPLSVGGKVNGATGCILDVGGRHHLQWSDKSSWLRAFHWISEK